MVRANRPGCLLVLAAASQVLMGCGEAEPVLYPLRGSVVYRGKPTPKAELVFHPQFGGPGWSPVATVNDDGTFEAGTKIPGDGALPGTYKVTAVWHPRATEDDPGPNFLPAKYSLPTTSPLEIVVSPEGVQPDTLELRD